MLIAVSSGLLDYHLPESKENTYLLNISWYDSVNKALTLRICESKL